MTSKSTIKAISVVIVILLFSLVFFLVPKYQGTKYLPHEEKEIRGVIHKDSIEAIVRVYVDKKTGEKLIVELVRENGDIDQLEKQVGTKQILYSHRLNAGEKYIIRISNETDSSIISTVRVEDND